MPATSHRTDSFASRLLISVGLTVVSLVFLASTASADWIKTQYKYTPDADHVGMNANDFTGTVTGGKFTDIGTTTTYFGKPQLADDGSFFKYQTGDMPPGKTDTFKYKVEGESPVVKAFFTIDGVKACATLSTTMVNHT